MEFKFDPIEEIVEEIRQGHIVIMQDPADRENEGDYICAAEFATPENINRMASEARGLICMPMAGEIADALYLLRWFVIIRTATRRHFLRQLILRMREQGFLQRPVP